jgi:tRNA(fMet)-specific endonuclease VapC
MTYMLDTVIASDVIKGKNRNVIRRLTDVPINDIAISAVTEGELLFGLAKRGNPQALAKVIQEFLIRVDVLPWDRDAAAAYGNLRADCEKRGVTLSANDMMIAAHAVATASILATDDGAFRHVGPPLQLENWRA